jgi:hypothetical protein
MFVLLSNQQIHYSWLTDKSQEDRGPGTGKGIVTQGKSLEVCDV